METVLHILPVLRDIGILVGIGFGLNFLRQQLALKKVEIEAKQATIDHLEKTTAPALAADLYQLSQTVDLYAKRKQELEKEVKRLHDEKVKAESEIERARLIGIAEGCLEGLGALGEVSRQGMLLSMVAPVPRWMSERIKKKQKQLWHAGAIALKGERPELVNMKKFLAEVLKFAEEKKQTQSLEEPPSQ